MTARERLITLVEQIPEDKLELAIERLELLVRPAVKFDQLPQAEPEVLEFDVPARPSRQVYYPHYHFHFRGPTSKVEMEIGEPSEENIRRNQRFFANIDWWNKHWREVVSDPSRRNKHVAISEGEIFLGTAYAEALDKALGQHPADVPYVFYLHNDSQE